MSLDILTVEDAIIGHVTTQLGIPARALEHEDDLFSDEESLPVCLVLFESADYEEEFGNSGVQDGSVAISVWVKDHNRRQRSLDSTPAYYHHKQVKDLIRGWPPGGSVCGPLRLLTIKRFRQERSIELTQIRFAGDLTEIIN